MKKLIKFKKNARLYFDLAEDKLEDGDYESAVYYFYQSFKEQDNPHSLLALGETYCEMGEPHEGLKYLLMALDRDPASEDICESLSECFACMDDDETAFFYFHPGMTVRRFRHIMQETERLEAMEVPKIKMVEKNDEMVLSIAAKLLVSGDEVYAKEMLLTVKPGSPYYVDANNMLALGALEADEPNEALVYIDKALQKKDTVEVRCTQLVALKMLGRDQEAQVVINIIEAQNMDLDGHKAAALAYIRIEDPLRAQRHLKALLSESVFNRDAIVSYALALYCGGDREGAKQQIVSACRLYPEDVAAREIAKAMRRGDKLSLFPLLSDDTAKEWLAEIDEKINVMRDTSEDFADDETFCEKLTWLYQSKLAVSQSKTSLALAKKARWHKFLRSYLLDNSMDLASKKVVLFSLLLYGGKNRLGFVLDGMYRRLKVRYPEGMDGLFRTAYCLAFSSYAFIDSGFEDRLLNKAAHMLKKYNAADFDKTKIKDEEPLAAALFYVSRHKGIVKSEACSHIFGCGHDEMVQYMSIFGIKEKDID